MNLHDLHQDSASLSHFSKYEKLENKRDIGNYYELRQNLVIQINKASIETTIQVFHCK